MGVRYAEVIGDPVSHSKSPAIHKFWLERMGLAGDYRATHVPRGGLGTYLDSRRGDPDWRGCNVTIPHKETIVPLLDECRTCGIEAVNCVVPEGSRLIGYNTDAAGVGAALPDNIDTHHPVCIVGAGGAARAAIDQLDIMAVYQFNFIVRDPANADALAAPHGQYGKVFTFDDAAEALRGSAGLINASPLGMDGFDPMPASVLDSLERLARGDFVFDMVYAPPETELLQRAATLRLRTADGLTMLIGQAEHAFSLFFGAAPDPA